MKLKILIIGPSVHNVGYRPWLTDAAINAGLDGFSTGNRKEEGNQSVLVLAEGTEDNVKCFENFIRENKPEQARVDRIDSESFAGSVMSLDKYAAINTTSQMNKAIPLLLSMDGKLDSMNGKMGCMLDKQDETISVIRGMHNDLIERNDFRLMRIEEDIKIIKARLSLS